MAEIDDLSTTDANNNGSAANAGFPENMNYSDVNNAARALEGMIARWHGDNNGTLDSTGSSNTYALAPNRTIGAYARGQEFEFEANHTNTGAATLNVSSLGAKNIVKTDGAALGANDIVSGGVYKVIYDGTSFQLVGVPASKLTLSATTAVDLSDGDNVLNVGATSGQHIAFDGNDIQSKSDATTASTISVNALGGTVNLGPQSGTGIVSLFANGAVMAQAATDAFILSSDDSPGIGSAQDLELLYQQSDGVDTARIGFVSATTFSIRNLNHGGTISIDAEDSGGTRRVLLSGDPAGASTLYYTGTAVGASQANGLRAGTSPGSNVSPTSGGVGQLQILADAYTGYIAADGTAMHVGHNSASRSLIFQTNETDRFEITGAGVIKFGTHNSIAAETITGYITIQDSGGTTRKLAVVS